MVVDDSGLVHGRDLLQRSEIHVETLAVVIVAEVIEAGVGGGLGVQYVGVERTLGRHRRHHVADLLRLGAEAGLCEVVEVDDGCLGIGHGDLCYSELRNDNRPWPTSRSPHRRRGAACDGGTAGQVRVRRPLGRRDRPAGRYQQAGDLPALAEQGAPRARGGVPDQRGDRAARHRLAGRRRPRNGASLGGRADHTGGAGGTARDCRGGGHGPDAARQAAGAVRRHPCARADRSSR